MSLFVCEECDCIENTATSRYWFRNDEGESGRELCSACDPKVGKWHGLFPRDKYDPLRHQPRNRPAPQPTTEG